MYETWVILYIFILKCSSKLNVGAKRGASFNHFFSTSCFISAFKDIFLATFDFPYRKQNKNLTIY